MGLHGSLGLCGVPECDEMPCDEMPCDVMPCDVLPCDAPCGTPLHVAHPDVPVDRVEIVLNLLKSVFLHNE